MVSAVLLASGGLDSTLIAAMLRPEVHLTADYGQRHRTEIGAAARVAAYYGAEHLVVDFRTFGRCARSALTGRGGDLTVPVVPNRNAFLIAVAVAVAVERGCSQVLIGVNATDAAGFPDCRANFIQAIDMASAMATGVGVAAPLLEWSKERIGKELRALDAPIELTWSCYRGGAEQCGRCGACTQRGVALDVHDQ